MSKLKNRNAAHAVSPDDKMHIRVIHTDKLDWRRVADKAGVSLTRWVIHTLNEAVMRDMVVLKHVNADVFNDRYPVGSIFKLNGRQVYTRGQAYVVGGRPLVKIEGRNAGISLPELEPWI